MAEWIGCAPGNYSTAAVPKIGVMPHWIVGSLQSCIDTFNSPGRFASTQYAVGGSRAVQFVDERYTSYHCGHGYYNGSLISIEHEGWPGSPPTRETLDTSAALMADVARRHGWGRYVLGKNVFLHQWVHATACPGETDVDYLVAKANQLLGDDIVTPEDIQAIAHAVWSFNQNGVLCRDRLQGTDWAANAASSDAHAALRVGLETRMLVNANLKVICDNRELIAQLLVAEGIDEKKAREVANKAAQKIDDD